MAIRHSLAFWASPTSFTSPSPLTVRGARILGKTLLLHSPSRSARSLVSALSSSSSAKKPKTVYECSECGRTYPKRQGQCDGCQAWSTLEPRILRDASTSGSSGGGGAGVRAAAAAAAIVQSGRRTATSSSPSPSTSTSTPTSNGAWLRSDDPSGVTSPISLTEAGRHRFQGNGNAWRVPIPGSLGAELGRVLGGGLVPGACMLVGGDPGVGKSTLLLQVADLLAGDGGHNGQEDDQVSSSSPSSATTVLYVSGEESAEQIASRGARMGMTNADGISLYCETDMERILDAVATLRPKAVVLDSVQTMYLSEAAGFAGSTTQVRECARALNQVCKATGTPAFLVGHVTKGGEIAGPKVLEHMVDVVAYLEGERQGPYRLLRVLKNRFGSTDEVAMLDMQAGGLEAVTNPSRMMLEARKEARGVGGGDGSGSAVTVVLAGRPLLVEVQALATDVFDQGQPRHTFSSGVDPRRVFLVLQVLQKHARVRALGKDLTVNVTGGWDLRNDPSADLALALAITSTIYSRPVPADVACVGELGLAGEVRAVPGVARRVGEAASMGMRKVLVSASGPEVKAPKGVEIVRVRTVREALRAALGTGKGKIGNEEGEEEHGSR